MVNTIQKIDHESRYPKWYKCLYLSKLYGLKIPKQQRSYRIFDYSLGNNKAKHVLDPQKNFETGKKYEDSSYVMEEIIHFSDLIGNRNINQDKLNVFYKYFELLINNYVKINALIKKFKTLEDFWNDISGLREWDDIDKFKTVIVNIPNNKKDCIIWKPLYNSRTSKVESILKELKEYNKPFRITESLVRG